MEVLTIFWAVGSLMAIPPWGNILKNYNSGKEVGITIQSIGLFILILSITLQTIQLWG